MVSERRCILAIFAHPDDESFGVAGTMRRCADRGDTTALICATRGEVGEISDPALATPETLGAVREAELRDACRIMGIADLSFLDYRDGELADADPTEAIGRIVYQIRRLRPQVVITFDANGGYGHLDHMAIHRQTLAAFTQAGDQDCYPEQCVDGLTPFAPSKLYAVAMVASAMRRMRDELLAQGISFAPGGNAATIAVEEMGTPDERVTTVVELTDREYEAKKAAMAAHRTQMNPNSPLAGLSDAARRAWLGTERFALLATRVPIEHDPFDGLP